MLAWQRQETKSEAISKRREGLPYHARASPRKIAITGAKSAILFLTHWLKREPFLDSRMEIEEKKVRRPTMRPALASPGLGFRV